jgi:hypothetical protein
MDVPEGKPSRIDEPSPAVSQAVQTGGVARIGKVVVE